MKSRLLGAVNACLFTLVTTLRISINITIARLILLFAGFLMVATVNAANIGRVNLDGSGLTTLVSGLVNPIDIALDLSGGHIYWTDQGSYPLTGKIQRANLDGTGVIDLETTSYPWAIALNVAGDQMYWSDREIDRIRRANLDGSGIVDLPLSGLGIHGLELDIASNHMYVSAPIGETIFRANLDGSGVTGLVTGMGGGGANGDIALDLAGGQMYWTIWAYYFDGQGKIQRANLDGSGVTDLVAGLFEAQDIALDVVNDRMYWTDSGTGKIQWANLDGTGVTDLVTGLNGPWGIALEPDAGHIYFTAQVIPLPASLWLFAPALASLGVVGWRRKGAA